MNDNLLDIIQHTYGFESLELIKISGTQAKTEVAGVAENKSVIIFGTFKQPLAEFEGTFGIPNLANLKTILSCGVYKEENSDITVLRGTRDDATAPASLSFKTKDGASSNEHRFMAKALIEDKVKSVQFKGATWNVEFEPSIVGIQLLKTQSSIHNQELHFTTKTEGGNLKVFFGDHSSHSGNMTFQPNVKGTLAKTWSWPVKIFLSIMDLPGDKTVRISDVGVCEITVDSGIAVWQYLLPAQSK